MGLSINLAYGFEPFILHHINVNISYATQAMAGIICSSLFSRFVFQEQTGLKGKLGVLLAIVSFGLMLWDSFEIHNANSVGHLVPKQTGLLHDSQPPDTVEISPQRDDIA